KVNNARKLIPEKESNLDKALVNLKKAKEKVATLERDWFVGGKGLKLKQEVKVLQPEVDRLSKPIWNMTTKNREEMLHAKQAELFEKNESIALLQEVLKRS